MVNKNDIDKAVERISRMEGILDKANRVLDELEHSLDEYNRIQAEINELDKYYSGRNWKKDFSLDESGQLPKDLKRGVLSEDGIYDMLERNKEIMDILNKFDTGTGE